MPYYVGQRQKRYGEAYDKQAARFVHYTSTDAGLKIIDSKRLWMRNTTCMADSREVQHGYDIIRQIFSDKAKLAAFCRSTRCVCTRSSAGSDQ